MSCRCLLDVALPAVVEAIATRLCIQTDCAVPGLTAMAIVIVSQRGCASRCRTRASSEGKVLNLRTRQRSASRSYVTLILTRRLGERGCSVLHSGDAGFRGRLADVRFLFIDSSSDTACRAECRRRQVVLASAATGLARAGLKLLRFA